MRIGYLVPQFPGQTHAFFWREIAELERLGAEVAVFSTRLPPPALIAHDWSERAIARTTYLGPPGIAGGLVALAGIAPALWAEARAGGFARDLLLCADPARRLARLCARRGVAHLHVHSCGRAALVAALARTRFGGVPYGLTLHGPLTDYGPGQGLKWRAAAFGTVITRKLMGEVAALLGPEIAGRCVVQAMGVDTARFTRVAPYAPPAPGAPFRIFACGRLNPVKGHAELAGAVALLAARGVDARLVIAGEDDDGGGGYRRALEARIDELGIADRVELLGAVGEAEIRARLSAAQVFALASWHEPLGVAYMEAMSCGVPVVGTDAGGVRELIADGESGVLVPPRDPEALARALAALAADPGRCRELGAAGRARVVAGFDSRLGARLILERAEAAAREAARPDPRSGDLALEARP
ncbi:MAG: colanic acid biosynthesis glycosyltransferase WcaL [Rhodovulum sulfidophilum]|uniref:Colanic acid biosynthesis glycosyltransferase WcaL n=1 Tax=Rhodovulum sulfidophilum TaxID=35806 RepID=A0A2W5NGX9_RHOSU|nr:MAG: colanic acid biosynthesis glycosyltransferase WcaL [Rhodovulum sulfidophilum]